MADINTRIGIEVDITGIDNSIRSTQRLLYFMNAIRLSITDFQKLIKDPSIEHLFWLGIQLTQVYTNLIRLIKQANRVAAGGGAANLLGLGGYGGGRAAGGRLSDEMERAFGGAAGMRIWGGGGTASQGLMATVTGFFAGMGPVGWGIIGAATTALVIGGNWYLQERERENWERRQREMARSQGLEY